MVGQFSELERKSVEPIALAVEGGKVRSMQRMISDAKWDEDLLLKRYHQLVSEDMGDDKGILIFDETSFVKKGDDSIGVSRQYCGTLGKIENCQVGVLESLSHLPMVMPFWTSGCLFLKSGFLMLTKRDD